jgi:hypothetical protein
VKISVSVWLWSMEAAVWRRCNVFWLKSIRITNLKSSSINVVSKLRTRDWE